MHSYCDDYTLVFDSAKTAKQYPDMKAIGLDELILRLIPEDKTIANDADRIAFIYEFLNMETSHADDFINEKGSWNSAFRFIISILDKIDDISPVADFINGKLSEEERDRVIDFLVLRDSYLSYLHRRGLTDPSYAMLDLSRINDEYRLVFPESSIRMQSFLYRAGRTATDCIELKKDSDKRNALSWHGWLSFNGLRLLADLDFFFEVDDDVFILYVNDERTADGIMRHQNEFEFIADISDSSDQNHVMEYLKESMEKDFEKYGGKSKTVNDFHKALDSGKFILIVCKGLSSIELQKRIGGYLFPSFRINKVSDDAVPMPDFYSNEKLETRIIMKDIDSSLREASLNPSDIVITLADYNRRYQSIMEEAAKLGIPAYAERRIPFICTAYGKLLNGFFNLLQNDFDPIFLESLSEIDAFSEEAGLKLRDSAVRIGKTIGKVKSVREKYNLFISCFPLKMDIENTGRAEYESVLNLAGSIDDVSLLQTVIRELETIVFPSKEGIRVVPYGSDILYPARKRYLMGINEESIMISSSIMISDSLLKSYVLSSCDLRISGSRNDRKRNDMITALFQKRRMNATKGEDNCPIMLSIQ